MFFVAIILLSVWIVFFLINKRHIKSGIVLFMFLLFMALPSLFEMHFLEVEIIDYIDYFNILILALLLTGGFLPWLTFDKALKNRYHFNISPNGIPLLKFIFCILIIGSLFSIAYLLPYAINSIAMGASATRELITEKSVLPETPLTTLVVGFAGLNIYNILAFYLSLLNNQLKKYRFWLFLSSFSYVVNSFAFSGRDGLIILPTFYIIFFIIFKNSINKILLQKVKRILCIIGSIVIIFLASFTISRFWNENKDKDTLYWGTLGYISQQPYVFDVTIRHQNNFHGFELRFPLINRLMGISKHEVVRTGGGFETKFGTMYAEFYSINGWKSMLLIAIIFVSYYSFSLSILKRIKNYFGLLLMFTVYLYIEITGLFYCKAGSAVLINIFYLTLSIIPFFVKNIITYTPHYGNNSHSNLKIQRI